jgi:hypothetical protein
MNSSPIPSSKLKREYGIKPWRLDSSSKSKKAAVEECNVIDDKTPTKKVD